MASAWMRTHNLLVFVILKEALMTRTSLKPAPKPASEPADDLPATWTAGARDTFLAVTEERDDLSSAELAALFHACALENAAERLDEVALAAGMVSRGSTGQEVIHPGVVEARLARTAAAAILARLHRPTAETPASARAARAAAARWSR